MNRGKLKTQCLKTKPEIFFQLFRSVPPLRLTYLDQMLKFSACFTSSTDKHITYLHRTILHWRGWEWVRTVTCQPEDVLLIQHKFSNLINNKIYISCTGQLDTFSCALCGQTFECLERKTFFSWIQNLRDRPSFKVNVTTSDECDNFLRFPDERRFAL